MDRNGGSRNELRETKRKGKGNKEKERKNKDTEVKQNHCCSPVLTVSVLISKHFTRSDLLTTQRQGSIQIVAAYQMLCISISVQYSV